MSPSADLDKIEKRLALAERQIGHLREELAAYGTMTRSVLDTIREAFRPTSEPKEGGRA